MSTVIYSHGRLQVSAHAGPGGAPRVQVLVDDRRVMLDREQTAELSAALHHHVLDLKLRALFRRFRPRRRRSR